MKEFIGSEIIVKEYGYFLNKDEGLGTMSKTYLMNVEENFCGKHAKIVSYDEKDGFRIVNKEGKTIFVHEDEFAFLV